MEIFKLGKISDKLCEYFVKPICPYACFEYLYRNFLSSSDFLKVTPGSKAAMKGMLAGDQIVAINGSATEQLTHMEAQNLIKNAGNRLQLQLK